MRHEMTQPTRPMRPDTQSGLQAQSAAESAPHSNVISTLAELRVAAAAGAWPSRGLALRAGALATNGALSSLLLRTADGHFIRGARLWLQIASYLDDTDQLVATLQLAAECAQIGGNSSFAHNCIRRAAAAERQRHTVAVGA